MTSDLLYTHNRKELPAVGAGPVPARCPDRGNNHGHIAAVSAPCGASGWHRVCPYTRQ